MSYRAVIAHVYSGPDSYAARSRKLGPFRPSPNLGSITVKMGRAPRWLFRARQRLYALDLLRGGSLARWLDGATDPKFQLPAGELGAAWYTTFTLELPPVQLNVVEMDDALAHETVLSEAALLLAADSTVNVIVKRELRGLFLQRADGKWVKCPEFEVFAPTVGVGHSKEALRAAVRVTDATFRSWSTPGSRSMRIDWALKALLTDEPWSQFV